MLNCVYKGNRLNAFFVADETEYAFRKEIKLASSSKELICEDCGSPMVFKNGPVMTAHFAHWGGYGEKCPYNFESEDLRRCKKILYNYFRKLYPLTKVELEYKIVPNRRSDLYICFADGNKLVIDIQKNNMSAQQWDNKHNDYKNAGITDLWIVNGVPASIREKSMPFFEQIMVNESNDGVAIFLNNKTEDVTLIKKIIFKDDKNNKEYSYLFERTYPLSDIVILPTGKIKSKFPFEYEMEEKLFIKSCVEKIRESEREIIIEKSNNLHHTYIETNAETATINTDGHKSNSEYYESYKRPDLKTAKQSLAPYSRNINLENIIRACIRNAVNGKLGSIEKIVKMLHYGPENYYAFKEVYADMIKTNNLNSQEICKEVLKNAGLD